MTTLYYRCDWTSFIILKTKAKTCSETFSKLLAVTQWRIQDLLSILTFALGQNLELSLGIGINVVIVLLPCSHATIYRNAKVKNSCCLLRTRHCAHCLTYTTAFNHLNSVNPCNTCIGRHFNISVLPVKKVTHKETGLSLPRSRANPTVHAFAVAASPHQLPAATTNFAPITMAPAVPPSLPLQGCQNHSSSSGL